MLVLTCPYDAGGREVKKGGHVGEELVQGEWGGANGARARNIGKSHEQNSIKGRKPSELVNSLGGM